MFPYTRAAFTLITDAAKKLIRIFQILLSLFTLAYLVLSLVFSFGNLYVNVALLTLYVCYTVFLLCTVKSKATNAKKELGRAYRVARLLLRAIPLGTTLYTLWITTQSTNGATIILTTLLLIFWIAQMLLELILFIVEPRITLLANAVIRDCKPFIVMHNMFHAHQDFKVDFDDVAQKTAILDPIVKKEKAAQAAKAAKIAKTVLMPHTLLVKPIKEGRKREKKNKHDPQ
jgi:hypothetical protein